MKSLLQRVRKYAQLAHEAALQEYQDPDSHNFQSETLKHTIEETEHIMKDIDQLLSEESI